MCDRRWTTVWLAAAVVIATALAAEAASPRESPKLSVRDVGEAFDRKYIEIRGVAAGAFYPGIWGQPEPHLLPDVRRPMLAPREGKHRNIYAPSVVQTKDGWRVYYGGWDGVETANDRIYAAETRDFLTFENRRTVIEHGDFQHVCNVNVTPTNKGFAMICTAFPDANGKNKPATFFSADGEHWNGATADAFPATRDQIVAIDGYKNYADADINGMNVLLFEAGKYRLYFGDFAGFAGVSRASGDDGKRFAFEEIVYGLPHSMVNDVKKFHVGTRDWYLMALHHNGDHLTYLLGRDGMHFGVARTVCKNLDDADRYMVAIGWVTAGEQEKPGRRLLGCLYGAGAKGSLDQNRIFATWLQKKALIVSGEKAYGPIGALGPDRQVFQLDAPMTGSIRLLAENGGTVLGTGPLVDFKSGRAYALEIQP